MSDVNHTTGNAGANALQWRKDRLEAAKNPFIPGARIVRLSQARQAYVNSSASMQRFYPLSEVNDLGLFTYIEKRAVTDVDRPWASQAHPDVNLYLFVLHGSGKAVLGVGDETFEEETYAFGENDLVVIPRGIPYKFTGEWNAVCLHARTSVFGTVAGNNRFTHPIITYEKPARPTREERDALREPGAFVCMDPAGSCGISGPVPLYAGIAAENLQHVRTDLPQPAEAGLSATELYAAVTPIDEQTKDRESLLQAKKNPAILGARVLRSTDAPAVYNTNAGNKKRGYPLTWTDDLAIFHRSTHSSVSDIDRPFDSHAHPDIEEYKYVISGSGTVTLGVGDDTFETETYEFQAGDLFILPRGVPHVDAGDFTVLHFHTRSSVFGKVPGTSRYPHNAYVYNKPPRPTQEERDALNEPGTYILMDSRETYNVYLPNPILRIEPNPNGMKHLRPDLFPEER